MKKRIQKTSRKTTSKRRKLKTPIPSRNSHRGAVSDAQKPLIIAAISIGALVLISLLVYFGSQFVGQAFYVPDSVGSAGISTEFLVNGLPTTKLSPGDIATFTVKANIGDGKTKVIDFKFNYPEALTPINNPIGNTLPENLVSVKSNFDVETWTPLPTMGGIKIAEKTVEYSYKTEAIPIDDFVPKYPSKEIEIAKITFKVEGNVGDELPITFTKFNTWDLGGQNNLVTTDLTVSAIITLVAPIVCTNEETKSCNTDLPGVCSEGTQTCSDNDWGVCIIPDVCIGDEEKPQIEIIVTPSSCISAKAELICTDNVGCSSMKYGESSPSEECTPSMDYVAPVSFDTDEWICYKAVDYVDNSIESQQKLIIPLEGFCITNENCGDFGNACADGESCKAGECIKTDCVTNCEGKVCGDDGCGGTCGECTGEEGCTEGTCTKFCEITLEEPTKFAGLGPETICDERAKSMGQSVDPSIQTNQNALCYGIYKGIPLVKYAGDIRFLKTKTNDAGSLIATKWANVDCPASKGSGGWETVPPDLISAKTCIDEAKGNLLETGISPYYLDACPGDLALCNLQEAPATMVGKTSEDSICAKRILEKYPDTVLSAKFSGKECLGIYLGVPILTIPAPMSDYLSYIKFFPLGVQATQAWEKLCPALPDDSNNWGTIGDSKYPRNYATAQACLDIGANTNAFYEESCVPEIPEEEICDNNLDEDEDNLIDCADPDCAEADNCQPECKTKDDCGIYSTCSEGTCAPHGCTGLAIANTVVCEGDGIQLTNGFTIKTVVETCTEETKCEYLCEDGYIKEENTCVLDIGQEICDGKDNDGDGEIDEESVCNTDENCGSFENTCPVQELCNNGVCTFEGLTATTIGGLSISVGEETSFKTKITNSKDVAVGPIIIYTKLTDESGTKIIGSKYEIKESLGPGAEYATNLPLLVEGTTNVKKFVYALDKWINPQVTLKENLEEEYGAEE
ncbi:hypothetical protein HOC13_00550 [Candidatus Woesearchaeota archaeon]|nr:hypothetical protein [Candidatus Woesearchaeota archaeon]